MERVTLLLLNEILVNNKKIEFNFHSEINTAAFIDIEIGDLKNEDCGPIYSLLSDWLSDSEFIEYLTQRGVYHDFRGEFIIINSEIHINLVLGMLCFMYDGEDEKCISFEEDFLIDELKIDLSSIGMKDSYDNERIKVEFCKKYDSPIEQLEMSYFDDDEWNRIELKNKQLEVLGNYIESIIEQEKPTYDTNFECEIIWEVDCEESTLNFSYYSTPIDIKLSDVIS
jgi:hypothetical protein